MIDLNTIPKIENIYKAFLTCHNKLDTNKKVMCSVSGGADSDIMIDLVEKTKPKDKIIHYVWFDTGIETQATKDHLVYLEKRYGITIERIKAKTPVPLGCKKYGLPFLTKYVSDMISRLQNHGFKWEDKPFEQLIAEYPKCRGALKWWCNEHEKNSSFNISKFPFLKEFMIATPPLMKISSKCCFGAKKEPSRIYAKENNIKIKLLGLRKAEGGIRATSYKTCFTEGGDNDIDQYRPIWWFTNFDKKYYELEYTIIHSECYWLWGLIRTGCAGCPFSSRFEEELEILSKYEPKLYNAVINIFGKSYEYTRDYREFVRQKRLNGQLEMNLGEEK